MKHCDKHTEFLEECDDCQEAMRAWHRQLLAEGKIESAGTEESDNLENEIQEILDAMGHPEAYVTDLSSVGDFFPSLETFGDEIPPERDEIVEMGLTKKLGVPVKMNDLLVNIAMRMRAKN